MPPSSSKRFTRVIAFACLTACGGGDGGTPPVTVATVVITPPAVAPVLPAVGRTVSFTAQARDASGNAIATATIAWNSSNTAVATVNGAGLVTAVANGTTSITASSGGQVSSGITVTVTQIAATLVVTPNAVSFGALGSTRQLAATLQDSGGAAMTLVGTVTFTLLPHAPVIPPTVTLTPGGLLTSALVTTAGKADSVQASLTIGPVTVQRVTVVTVAQLVATVAVTSTSGVPDTLFAATRTRQFTGTARDSNNNVIAASAFTWASTAGPVASVNPTTGLVTAATDGSASIQATSGGITGSRAVIVRRLAASHSISAPTGSISTDGGTLGLSGTAQDSAAVAIPMTWLSRSAGIVTVAPLTGAATVVTARGNGSAFVVFSIPVGLMDSSNVTVTNQALAPSTVAVTIGDQFFRSARNNTQNTAIDTLAVGGTVTWTWTGFNPHSVASTGSPTFANSTLMTGSGTYVLVFNTAGTYNYECGFHGPIMTGRIVVR